MQVISYIPPRLTPSVAIIIFLLCLGVVFLGVDDSPGEKTELEVNSRAQLLQPRHRLLAGTCRSHLMCRAECIDVFVAVF